MSKVQDLKPKPYTAVRGGVSPNSQIIAVGGGKGGVGKSFVSSNLAIFLANLGHNTILIDLDLGAANAHTSLGERLPPIGLSDYIEGNVSDLEDCAVSTRFPSLRLISGCNDDLEIANLGLEDRSELMSSIHALKADYIILDLSAGTHLSTIDFFLMASRQVMVFTPEPSSIENAYRFMKSCYFRKVKRYEKQLGVQKLVKNLMSNKDELGIKTPADLIENIIKEDPTRGTELKSRLDSLCFEIILNQTRTFKDIEIGESVKSVSHKFFGLNSSFLGHLDYDNAVWQALRKHRPLLLEYPHSRLYSQILSITKSIAYPASNKAIG